MAAPKLGDVGIHTFARWVIEEWLRRSNAPDALPDTLCDVTAGEAEQVDIIGPVEDAIRNVNAILRRRRTINAERDAQKHV